MATGSKLVQWCYHVIFALHVQLLWVAWAQVSDPTSGEDASVDLSSSSNEVFWVNSTQIPSHEGLGPPGAQGKPLWEEVFDRSQLVLVILGFVGNVVTVITLVKNGNAFSTAILILMRHQSVVDAGICAMATATLVQPYMWLPGQQVLDAIVCQVWHSHTVYFTCVSISIHNLVAIAAERYLAVCQPFKHVNLTSKKVYIIIAALYIGNFIAVSPGYAQVRLAGGQCVPEYLIRGRVGEVFFSVFAFMCFTLFFAIPSVLFFALYGCIIFAFRKRRQGEFASSRVIDKATSDLTRTAFIVTAIFMLTNGYDLGYYILGYSGVVQYKVNSPLQKIGVWLVSFNSASNPLVYTLLMPAFRASLRKTFFLSPKAGGKQMKGGARQAAITTAENMTK